MAGRKTTKAKQTPYTKQKTTAKERQEEQKRVKQLWAILLFSIGILILALSIIQGQNVWKFFHNLLYGLFGPAALAIAPVLIYVAVMASMDKPIRSIKSKFIQTILLVVLISAAVQVVGVGEVTGNNFLDKLVVLYENGTNFKGSGIIGGLVAWPLISACGRTGAGVIVFVLLFTLFMIITGSTLIGFLRSVSKPVKKISDEYVERKKEKEEIVFSDKFDIDVAMGPELPGHPVASQKIKQEDKKLGFREKAAMRKEQKRKIQSENEGQSGDDDPAEGKEPPLESIVQKAVQENLRINEGKKSGVSFETKEGREYEFPSLSCLKLPKRTGNRDVSEELKANAERLVDTLKSFGVQTRVIDISRGPTVTRYELQPSAGVKISRITGLADDIALNLATAGVRIEAPIPNKPAVGIEVPNKTNDVVTLREIVDSREFREASSRLTVCLGKDIAGNVVTADLAKMPHLLVAGATGSGKSVCINSIIMSLMYKASPQDVRLMLVDPKVVELGIYNGIPHMLVPVVTDPRKAAGALNWAVTEMLNRYKIFADKGVRDLKGYNKLANNDVELNPMPQIVIIIDELADLMMAAPNEVEDAICRLAQMARAAGMHLIIATQRPSVDVITGVIKANIPSRIAFSVSSQVDSRTILDGAGAEKLLGRGDMLFNPVGAPKPVRVQGCFVSDKEVEQVVDAVKTKGDADYDEEIIDEIDKRQVQIKGSKSSPMDIGGGFDEEDEMLSSAVECVLEAGQASTSYLQRKLKVGYARAARLVDDMETKGIVGPLEGSKPRAVLITRQQWIEMNMNKDAQNNASQ